MVSTIYNTDKCIITIFNELFIDLLGALLMHSEFIHVLFMT